MLDEPIIAPSAYKHGLSREDILHAYRNPLRIWDLGDGFTMMIGPNRAALILEVGYVEGDVAMVIVHAMPVSYTHLDVYKRQPSSRPKPFACGASDSASCLRMRRH